MEFELFNIGLCFLYKEFSEQTGYALEAEWGIDTLIYRD